MSDPASTYARLKAETAAMLGLDPADLSKTEGLRLDITSLLLLEIHSLQGSILANDQIDLARLSSALTMLQKLLPSEALNAPVPLANSNHDFAGAKEELDRLLIQRAERLEAREIRESERLREEIAHLREENARLAAQIKAEPQPAPPAPAAQPSNVAYLPSRTTDGRPSPHYLKDGQPREPWDCGGSDGVLIAPAWSPPGYK